MTTAPFRRAWAATVGLCAALAVAGLCLGPASAWAAPAAPPPATQEGAKPEASDNSSKVILLGSTIFGTVVEPNAAYDVPWQEPFLLGRGAGELERNFLKEIFRPMDRDEFLKQSAAPGTARQTP